ncbi:DUF4136 domain-containing protein [Iodidimonas sp. SYSU 1G8]|uniref:DUF4136 domain-containing protein n=1 Tax=Iodidimonas sp. SYSU 1G8 TaxID=3133967 RepID=UPI0031FEA509
MANTSKIIVALAAVLMLAGCASKFRSDVSSWHRLPAPSGETFVIDAKDPRKQGSLEFAQYASLVAAQLERVGYRSAARGGQPDLIVRLDYGLDGAREKVRSSGGGLYGGYYGYHRPFWGPYGWGYGGFDDYPDVRSYTVYQRKLEMEIADARNPGQNLYETRVVSDGRSNRLEEVMPLMVRTLFEEFPGPSGVTREISIDLDKAPASSRY